MLPYLQKLPRFIRSNPRSSILLTVEMLIFSQFLVAIFFYRQVLSIIIIFLALKRSDDKRQMACLLRKFYLRNHKNSIFFQAQIKTLPFYFSTFNIPIVTNHIRYRKPFASPWLRIMWNNTLSNKLLKWSQI